jgi:2-polyprenyl-6-methoxyphenol hydroxylase-like FAD-dependent oxidoreductase
MSHPFHVLISGAGLAGPALAIALAKQSIKSTIFERRAFSQDIGGVIMLAPNAMHVMNKVLEIGDRLRSYGESFDAIHLYTKSSTALDKVGGFMLEDEGVQGLSISRPVLHQALLFKCDEMKDMIEVRYGAKVTGIKEDQDGVEATLEGGEVLRGESVHWPLYELHVAAFA